MHEAQKDTRRALAAAKAICDGRYDRSSILVTLDHTIALILIAAMDGDAKKAVQMLHEGIIPGVEERIALFASKRK